MEMKTEFFLEKKRVRETVFAFCGIGQQGVGRLV